MIEESTTASIFKSIPATSLNAARKISSDPDLKKVVAKTWEAGVRGKLGQDIHWNIGAYNTKTENDIQFIFSSQSMGYFKNMGETERKGIEINLLLK